MAKPLIVLRRGPRFDGDHERFFFRVDKLPASFYILVGGVTYRITRKEFDYAMGKYKIEADSVGLPKIKYTCLFYADWLIEIHPIMNDATLKFYGHTIVEIS